MKRLKVGISVIAAQDNAHATLWQNGIGQNIVFLGLLLQRLPEVELTTLVLCGPGALVHPLTEAFGFPSMTLSDAAESLDIIIELGARCDADQVDRFRARGGKLVSYMAGNTMIMNFEDLANDVRHGDFISVPFDACWITPQHWKTNRSYASVTRTPNVAIVPHIWDPICLDQSAFRARLNAFWRPPQSKAWRIGVFDPSINVVKTFHMPLMVVEEAFRARPDLIDRVMMFSAIHLKGNPHFEDFCGAMDLIKTGKVFAEARFPVAEMLGTNIDAVVTHQWENNLNYLYWDVLYLGWPLIHNSTEFSDVGYYFPEFDPASGGSVLIEALENHTERARLDRPKVLETLWQFNINNPVVQRQHVELLEAVMG